MKRSLWKVGGFISLTGEYLFYQVIEFTDGRHLIMQTRLIDYADFWGRS